MGPTASGKTSLAIELAKAINGEVISVDSALVYTHMDIGTAKPSIKEQAGVTHHLIDIINPEAHYSVANFLTDAAKCIEDILSRGKHPILAGGTMMYFNALINGINELPQQDERIREQIQNDITTLGLAAVHKKLAQIDPTSANRIHANDTQRTIRALEVFYASGKTMSQWQQSTKAHQAHKFLQFSIMPRERAVLHERIAQRFDIMLKNNFVEEVQFLRSKYNLHADLPSVRCVGYRQVWQYLEGELDATEMRERGIIATRQLAKRQMTWLRKWQDIYPLMSDNDKNLPYILEKISASAYI